MAIAQSGHASAAVRTWLRRGGRVPKQEEEEEKEEKKEDNDGPIGEQVVEEIKVIKLPSD